MAPNIVSLGVGHIVLLLLSIHADARLNSHIGLGATHMSKESAAGAELFANEAFQLTESILVDLMDDEYFAQYASLFAFGNGSTNHKKLSESAQACKTYPGDALWPSADLWEAFDSFLGGALSPITPIGSPCYKDSVYHNYDASLCASVTEGWVEESTQYGR